MRVIVIVVLVVALAVLLAGVVNHANRVDVSYAFGTWDDVSLVVASVVIAGLVLVVGIGAAVGALAASASDRRKLERELEETYERLRAAEASSSQATEARATPSLAAGGETAATVSPQPPARGSSHDAASVAASPQDPGSDPAVPDVDDGVKGPDVGGSQPSDDGAEPSDGADPSDVDDASGGAGPDDDARASGI